MRCAMTGRPMKDTSEGIWDDGEWISWDWINGQIEEQALQAEFPNANLDVVKVFHDLVALAQTYKGITGRYLQIWGELGELYAEIKFGVARHRPGTPGSDGRIGNDWIEVKTISPEKLTDAIQIKTAGNFNKILIVKINGDFEFTAKLLDRRVLGKSSRKRARVKWESNSDESDD